MAFSEQFLDEVRARAGLADVIGRHLRLSRRGREHLGLCPFHKEKTPSFTVSDEKGFYHCFGCGAHGSVIDFVMHVDGLSFPEAVERLAGQAGLQVPVDSPEERARANRRQSLHAVMEAAQAWFEKSLRLPEGKPAFDYLRHRGLDDETMARFHLGYAPSARGALKGALARQGIEVGQMVDAGLLIVRDAAATAEPGAPAESAEQAGSAESYDRFRGRVMFPITDKRGRVIAFGGRILGEGEPKYLNSPETDLFSKRRVLYGLAQAQAGARRTQRLVVTEGYMDVIALHRAGFDDAVAPLGTALSEDHMRAMWRLVREPVLCFDGDAAGARAAARAAERALAVLQAGYSLAFATMPAGQDPDSLIAASGGEAMAGVLDAAVPLSEVLWRMETGGRVPQRPEERAALERRLDEHARRIEDAGVRAHFRAAFRQRLWPKRRPRRDDWAPSMDLDASSASGARLDPGRQAQKVLIAIVMNHPEGFAEVEEDFGSVAFADQALDALRQDLIAAFQQADGPDHHRIQEAMRERGHGATLGDVFGDQNIWKDPAIGPMAAPDDVARAWRDTLRVLGGDTIRAEIEAGRQRGATGYSGAEWERQRALIQAALDQSED